MDEAAWSEGTVIALSDGASGDGGGVVVPEGLLGEFVPVLEGEEKVAGVDEVE